ncbi:hypothetical protein Cgig2_033382 [Carnegiea gigantea]|uniref:RING-type E3 ubiquitin transferase n=1 Tax=Carnegiea gigantea TaxID=171969 RepID=A0A9Q1KV85_9CARY|nr:hypothetical protein Cgig2_033382 [Carnegiea gigantea]
MSTTNDAESTTPLLPPTAGYPSFRSQSRHFSRRAGIQGAARFLRRTNSRRMMTEQSVRVREAAAEQIDERQSDWAYSTPIVVLDLLWNTIFVMVIIVMLILSWDERSQVPLRTWLVGYGVQCILHMVCVCLEYSKRRREMSLGFRNGSGSGSNSNLNLDSRSNSSSSVSVDGDFVQCAPEQREDEDNTSRVVLASATSPSQAHSLNINGVAKHLESANTMFSFIWWIIGFYWVSSGGQTLADDAPKLYWLTITFLAFDVFFVVICVAVACIIGIAVCCCLPCIIAILYAVADQEGASKEDIELLPKYTFRPIGEYEKQNGEIQESFGGIMTECNSETPAERVLSLEDARCCICLSAYDDGDELRELPCRHHFHSACIDKWLHMNATCPLCKYNILKNGNQSSDEV